MSSVHQANIKVQRFALNRAADGTEQDPTLANKFFQPPGEAWHSYPAESSASARSPRAQSLHAEEQARPFALARGIVEVVFPAAFASAHTPTLSLPHIRILSPPPGDGGGWGAERGVRGQGGIGDGLYGIGKAGEAGADPFTGAPLLQRDPARRGLNRLTPAAAVRQVCGCLSLSLSACLSVCVCERERE